MKLIADCGSTKIDWCALADDGTVGARFHSPGINAVMLTEEEIRARLAEEAAPQLTVGPVDEVYFYGAGCISPEVCASVERALAVMAPAARRVEVATDLLAAARALCGREPGIACILGTGSNSCYYSGTAIADNVSPLGYILGDEGSGAVLGRLFLGDVLKNQIPGELAREFLDEYGLDRLEVIRRVYREPAANRFLASFAPFAAAHMSDSRLAARVRGCFEAFVSESLAAYPADAPVGFAGSLAAAFAPMFRGLLPGRELTFVPSPLEPLAEYHQGVCDSLRGLK